MNGVLSLGLAWLVLATAGCSAPAAAPCIPDPAPGVVGSICGFENPEDVEVIAPFRALVVSQMRHDAARGGGSLVWMPLDATDPKPRALWPAPGLPEPGDTRRRGQRAAALGLDADCSEPPIEGFSPHGISTQLGAGDDAGVILLAVVSHAPREAIEWFELLSEGGVVTARWLGCVRLPEPALANDVVFGGPGELLVTKYRPTRDDIGAAYYSVIAGLGADTGEVLRWRAGADGSRASSGAGAGWQSVPDTEGASPNGLLLAADGSLFFSQTGTGRVGRVGASRRRDARIGGHPDNLAWAPDGRVLAVTHTEGPAFLLCLLGRSPCRTAWSLYAIDATSLEATRLLDHDGSVVGGVASVAVYEGRYFFGAVFDDRIGVWRPIGAESGVRGDTVGGVLQTARSARTTARTPRR